MDFHSVKQKEWSITEWSYTAHYLLKTVIIPTCSNLEVFCPWILTTITTTDCSNSLSFTGSFSSQHPLKGKFSVFRLIAEQSTWLLHLSLQLQWSFLHMSHSPNSHFRVLPSQNAANSTHHFLHSLSPIIIFLLSSFQLLAHHFLVAQALDSSLFPFLSYESNQSLSSNSFYYLHLPLVFLHSNLSYMLLAEKSSWVITQVKKKLWWFIMNYIKNLNSLAWHHHLWATVFATFCMECPPFSISLLKSYLSFKTPVKHHLSMKSFLISMGKSELSFL